VHFGAGHHSSSGVDLTWNSPYLDGFMFLFLPVASVIGADIPPLLIIPFGLLLVLIAVMPLAPKVLHHLWERFYPLVAIGLGLLVTAFYLFRLPGGDLMLRHTLYEYFSFISLIGSLFVVAGGIHVKVKGEATPLTNVVFLTIGAITANIIGTTGAAMVLIRPWIRLNKIRISAYHIVFFIFIVANCGGALTPIGDPPLFLGYLRGVPFFWLVEHVMAQWMVTVGAILLVFYYFDHRSFSRAPLAIQEEIRAPDTWQFEGGVNVLLLVVIVAAVFLPDVWFAREIVMIAAAVASHRLTPQLVHEENQFTYGPIKEVAFLFIGIFLTMMPALNYLDQHGREFSLTRPAQYYFAAGSLSSVLDNTPTYLNFLELAQAVFEKPGPGAPSGRAAAVEHSGVQDLLAHRAPFIIAISLGAVFFGAMTYIGNGPNFMVKSIAEGSGVRVPTFFGYILKYSLPFLLPILVFSAWVFL
jgi:Na+/H+ antiporter NhaD/arsenite permease-like protein